MTASVTFDVTAARAFIATHGRNLDRRRVEVIFDGAPVDGLLAALDGYRNDDGGYGWGLESDLRSPESQPTAAMHAFEVLAEVGPAATPLARTRAAELCDWLDAHTLPDGGLPFACAITDPAGVAPWWLDPDTKTSSIQMTTQVAATAHLLARYDPAVGDHPWLARATEWCLDAIGGLDEAPHAYELLFSIHFLDAAAPVEPRAAELLEGLRRFIPDDGVLPVAGGAEGEAVRPLDLAPRADGPARQLFTDDLITADRRRLAERQEADGGWTVDFVSSSPAGAIEWRAFATVAALLILTADA